VDLSAFLTPLEGDDASGIDLRNEAGFHAVERMVEPAGKVQRSEGGNPFQPRVDWQAVAEEAGTLAATGRDLRLLAIVARAAFNTDGFGGLAAGIGLLTDTIESYWESVHPLLREASDPREAALRRINALKQLENDDNGLFTDLKMNAILSPRGIGPISGADLAAGGMTDFEVKNEMPSGLSAAEQAQIMAAHEARVNRVKAGTRALAAEQADEAAALVAGIGEVEAAIAALSASFAGKAGMAPGMGIVFPDLAKHLARMKATLSAAVGEAGGIVPVAGGDAPPGAPAATSSPATTVAAAAPAQQGLSGTISSRADVERALDQIITFYERTEPSSPIPHFARRLKKMVPMDFLQLMTEVAPSGMKEFKLLAGVGDRDK
jgi:type VI secretion system protein ImpA